MGNPERAVNPDEVPEVELKIDIDRLAEQAEQADRAESGEKPISESDRKMQTKSLEGRIRNLDQQKKKFQEWGDAMPKATVDKLNQEISDLSAQLAKLNPENPLANLSEAEIDATVEQMGFEDDKKFIVREPGQRDIYKKPSAETETVMAELATMRPKTESEQAVQDAMDIIKGDGAIELNESDLEEIKPLAETPAEKQFFESKPDFNRMDEEGVIERNPQAVPAEKAVPQLKRTEANADLSKFGLTDADLDKRAVSGWAKLKLGFRSMFNSELRQAVKEHDVALDAQAQLDANVEKGAAAQAKDRAQYEARKNLKRDAAHKPSRPGAGPTGPGTMKF